MPKAAISAPVRDPNFERVFLEQYPRIYAALVRLVGDRAEAEDLALETFWQFHRSAPNAGGAQNLGGWLYRVATNLGLNFLRSRKRRERYELEAGTDAITPQPADDPEAMAEVQEERDRVRQVLAQMDSRRGQLLLMRHSGMSYEELASALGVSANSIGPLLDRAEREFEKRWQMASRAPLPATPSQAKER